MTAAKTAGSRPIRKNGSYGMTSYGEYAPLAGPRNRACGPEVTQAMAMQKMVARTMPVKTPIRPRKRRGTRRGHRYRW
jgi:hypothetical protein